jgi:hypothetical protein
VFQRRQRAPLRNRTVIGAGGVLRRVASRPASMASTTNLVVTALEPKRAASIRRERVAPP